MMFKEKAPMVALRTILGKKLISLGKRLQKMGARLKSQGKQCANTESVKNDLRDDSSALPYFSLSTYRDPENDLLVFRDKKTRDYMSKIFPGSLSETPSYPPLIISKDKISGLQTYRGRTLHAHVDGSVDGNYLHYSWAVAFIEKKLPVKTFWGTIIDPHKVTSQATLAELTASLCAIEASRMVGASKVVIYHDFKGVNPREETTAKSKKPEIIAYREAVSHLSKSIKISFSKISSKNNIAHGFANHARQTASTKLDSHLKRYMSRQK